MTQRLYICGLYGDGLTVETAWHSAFDEVFEGTNKRRRQVIDGVDVKYALVVADTDATEHALLVADTKVRHVTKAFLLKKRSELTGGQVATLTEILTFLNQTRAATIFTQDALVLDLLRWLNGSRRWDGLAVLEE